jgi:hypothetical protein
VSLILSRQEKTIQAFLARRSNYRPGYRSILVLASASCMLPYGQLTLSCQFLQPKLGMADTLYMCFGGRCGIGDCSYTLQDCMLAAVSDVERGTIPSLIFESGRREVGKHAIMGLRYMFEKHLEFKILWGFKALQFLITT